MAGAHSGSLVCLASVQQDPAQASPRADAHEAPKNVSFRAWQPAPTSMKARFRLR